MVRNALRRPLAAGAGFLALIGIAASAAHYLYEPYNLSFLKYPNIVALHVIRGGVYHASIAEAWIRLTRKRRVPRRSGAGHRMMPTAKEGR